MLRLPLLAAVAMFLACGPAVAPCSTTTCAGCCDQMTGQCVAGTETTACGVGGRFCVACPGVLTCSTSGQCVMTVARCNASNCEGCCDDTQQCFTGRSADACGTGGATCGVCSGSQTCQPVSTGTSVGGRCQ